MSTVSDPNLPPEQWRPLFDALGIEFGYRPLATRADMNHTRVRRVLRGEGTSEDAIRLVADALGVSPAKVHELRGEPAVEREPFILPDDAGRLTDRERDVIRAMVRALIEAKDRHADQPATPTTLPRAPLEAAEGQKTFAVLMVRSDEGPAVVVQETIGAESETHAVEFLDRTLQLAGFDTIREARLGSARVDLAADGPGGSLLIDITPADPALVDRADENLRAAVGAGLSTVQRSSGKLPVLNWRPSARKLDIPQSRESSDDVLRVSYNDEPSTAASTSNVSEQAEDLPAAARRGGGKSEGRRRREQQDRDAEDAD
ncbi:immunity repressor [Gordonia phage Eviarto]|uniref:Immunity repressor n=2 Tax=Nymphadoravirus nymphadora TaxID=2560507 RepID=A0A142KAS0_9CAUD|nr:transcriptional repressor [Gordonia phage Nymphadora]AMS03203.1 immunity repressor [Gordonia phage Nymphadora]QDP43325.1 immunity repressor [Gordonia phage Eviarto]